MASTIASSSSRANAGISSPLSYIRIVRGLRSTMRRACVGRSADRALDGLSLGVGRLVVEDSQLAHLRHREHRGGFRLATACPWQRSRSTTTRYVGSGGPVGWPVSPPPASASRPAGHPTAGLPSPSSTDRPWPSATGPSAAAPAGGGGPRRAAGAGRPSSSGRCGTRRPAGRARTPLAQQDGEDGLQLHHGDGAPTQRCRPAPNGIHVHGFARSSALRVKVAGRDEVVGGSRSPRRSGSRIAGVAPTRSPAWITKPPYERSCLATRRTRISGGWSRNACLIADSGRGISRSAWWLTSEPSA